MFRVLYFVLILVTFQVVVGQSTNKSEPELIEFKSENYPNPYPNQVNRTINCSKFFPTYPSINIIIHDLLIDPKTDFLQIINQQTNQVFTGNFSNTEKRFLNFDRESCEIRFFANHNESHQFTGFRISVEPFVLETTTPVITTPPTEKPELVKKIETIRRKLLLQGPLVNAINFTSNFREYLSNATNKFIVKHEMKYRETAVNDVYIKQILPCLSTWPNNERCLIIDFGVPLEYANEIVREARTFTEPTTTEISPEHYEMSVESLNSMWDEFAVGILLRNGIENYSSPNYFPVLLVWILISISIVAAFIFVLYKIWRIDFFKDYRRMSRGAEDDNISQKNKEPEYDISMFPSPLSDFQSVPALFPDSNTAEIPHYSGVDNKIFYTEIKNEQIPERSENNK